MKKVVLNIFLCIILLYPFSFSFAQLATAFDVHITIDSMFRLGYQVQETFDAVGRKKETHFLDKKGYKQGPVYWYYTNGKLKAKGYFKKDKLNGEYQVYNQEGRILIFCTYQNGLLHGKYEQFFQDGKKAMEGAFVKGNKEGYFREYHYGIGSLRAEWKAVRGKRQGKGIWYYPNQKIHFICYFANDKLEGEYIVYDTIGRILKIQSYQNNLLHGEYIRYHPNGQIATKATYVKGKLHGEFVRFYDNGQLLSKVSYKKGKKHGILHRYYATGELEMTALYLNDFLKENILIYDKNGKLKEGYHYHTYPNGLPHVIGYCVQGKPDGILEEYDESGVIHARLKFKKGILHDISQYFNGEGSLLRLEFYEEGVFIKQETLGN